MPETPGDDVDVKVLAEIMGLPLAAAPGHGLETRGPEAIGGRALVSAEAPDLRLPDLDGNEFALSSLRGKEVFLYAWAPY